MEGQGTNERDREARPSSTRESGALLLAAGGLAAALAAASCCALPAILGAVGLGALGLGGLELIALSDRPLLLGAAAVCLVGVGVLLLWRRHDACAWPRWRRLTLVVASAAALFVILAAVIV